MNFSSTTSYLLLCIVAFALLNAILSLGAIASKELRIQSSTNLSSSVSVISPPQPSRKPTAVPSKSLSATSVLPTKVQSFIPSKKPTPSPTIPASLVPSMFPYKSIPSALPSNTLSKIPSAQTSKVPSAQLTQLPSKALSKAPSKAPSKVPLTVPSSSPSNQLSIPTIVPSPSQNMKYHHNGSVMLGNISLYNIYLGNFSANTRSLVDYFASNIGNSQWYKTLTSYYQFSSNKQSFITQSVKFQRSLSISFPGMSLTTSLIGLLVNNALIANGIAVCDHCIFITMFDGSFTFPGWGSDWCGYHSLFAIAFGSTKSSVLKLGVLGDPTSAKPPVSTCIPFKSGRTSNADFAGDSMVTTYAQQLADIVTNYDGRTWYRDSDGIEVGSACSFNFQTAANSNIEVGTKKFLVQSVWQNGVGCTLSKKWEKQSWTAVNKRYRH